MIQPAKLAHQYAQHSIYALIDARLMYPSWGWGTQAGQPARPQAPVERDKGSIFVSRLEAISAGALDDAPRFRHARATKAGLSL